MNMKTITIRIEEELLDQVKHEAWIEKEKYQTWIKIVLRQKIKSNENRRKFQKGPVQRGES